MPRVVGSRAAWILVPVAAVLGLHIACRCHAPETPGAAVGASDRYVIPSKNVYAITEKGEFIYFATSDRGIFRFRRTSPQTVETVAATKAPIRGLLFHQEKLLALSYTRGLLEVVDKRLRPAKPATPPGWSLVHDESRKAIGVAGDLGVVIIEGERIKRVKRRGAHDIVFHGSTFAVAHRAGISVHHRQSGAVVRERFPGINFWSARRHGDLIVYGGKGRVVLQRRGRWQTIALPDAKNVPWSSALVKRKLYIGTQRGLFVYDLTTEKLSAAGFPGQCIKALFSDSRGTLWIGRFG